jgi:ADP-ribose pyrophosphatase
MVKFIVGESRLVTKNFSAILCVFAALRQISINSTINFTIHRSGRASSKMPPMVSTALRHSFWLCGNTMTDSTDNTIHYQGRFLSLVSQNGWEYATRVGSTGVVAILAVTDDDRVILIEQFRPPVGKSVIEIPAGLAGDIVGSESEAFAEAAQRELLEETGYAAAAMRELQPGPSSAGLTDELITFFEATGLTKEGEGGGDESESITVHEIPRPELRDWLNQQAAAGKLIDPKIAAVLWMAGK